MNLGTALVVIAAIFAFLEWRKAKLRAEAGIVRDMMGNEQVALPQTDAAMQREVIELRQRVEVLERIVTENRQAHDIAREIEGLRDRTEA
jgi:hypothetical protein